MLEKYIFQEIGNNTSFSSTMFKTTKQLTGFVGKKFDTLNTLQQVGPVGPLVITCFGICFFGILTKLFWAFRDPNTGETLDHDPGEKK